MSIIGADNRGELTSRPERYLVLLGTPQVAIDHEEELRSGRESGMGPLLVLGVGQHLEICRWYNLQHEM